LATNVLALKICAIFFLFLLLVFRPICRFLRRTKE